MRDILTSLNEEQEKPGSAMLFSLCIFFHSSYLHRTFHKFRLNNLHNSRIFPLLAQTDITFCGLLTLLVSSTSLSVAAAERTLPRYDAVSETALRPLPIAFVNGSSSTSLPSGNNNKGDIRSQKKQCYFLLLLCVTIV